MGKGKQSNACTGLAFIAAMLVMSFAGLGHAQFSNLGIGDSIQSGRYVLTLVDIANVTYADCNDAMDSTRNWNLTYYNSSVAVLNISDSNGTFISQARIHSANPFPPSPVVQQNVICLSRDALLPAGHTALDPNGDVFEIWVNATDNGASSGNKSALVFANVTQYYGCYGYQKLGFSEKNYVYKTNLTATNGYTVALWGTFPGRATVSVQHDGDSIALFEMHENTSRLYATPGGDILNISVCKAFYGVSLVSTAAWINVSFTPAGKSSDCSVAPGLSVTPLYLPSYQGFESESGRVHSVEIQVAGRQEESCGNQTYGVDFTNAYAGKDFSLAIDGKQERNLFTLAPGEIKQFKGWIGVTPGTAAGNYTVQVTAYSEADHWNQVSQDINVSVNPSIDYSDTYWSVPLGIGWYNIPYVYGTGVFGCDNITEAYGYLASHGEYVKLERYGPVFMPPAGLDDSPLSLFVFSRGSCVMYGNVPASTWNSLVSPVKGGQLVPVPPAWDGAQVGSMSKACLPGQGVELSIKKWDGNSQTWLLPSADSRMSVGEVYQVYSSQLCNLDLSRPLDSG
ncbi:MAG: hypothetical protein WC506_06420 [Candidatus Micrarchaeia archaeon]